WRTRRESGWAERLTRRKNGDTAMINSMSYKGYALAPSSHKSSPNTRPAGADIPTRIPMVENRLAAA
ncbi:MAG: hypothetical protein NT071_04985, partial [Burkholderiales bacterium]|nr:hypothetical protein [Burkholderiales bacterium]